MLSRVYFLSFFTVISPLSQADIAQFELCIHLAKDGNIFTANQQFSPSVATPLFKKPEVAVQIRMFCGPRTQVRLVSKEQNPPRGQYFSLTGFKGTTTYGPKNTIIEKLSFKQLTH